MENKIESLELEEMRLQMAALKEQLEEQVQVNDELIVKQMKSNVHSLNAKGLLTLVVAVVCAYPMYIYCTRWGVPVTCFWTIIIGVLLDGCITYYVTNKVKENDLQTCRFSDIISKLLAMKKGMRMLAISEFFFLFIILIWLSYATFTSPSFANYSAFDQTKVPFIFTTGAICGLYFGGKEMKKRIRQIDEMMKTLSKE